MKDDYILNFDILKHEIKKNNPYNAATYGKINQVLFYVLGGLSLFQNIDHKFLIIDTYPGVISNTENKNYIIEDIDLYNSILYVYSNIPTIKLFEQIKYDLKIMNLSEYHKINMNDEKIKNSFKQLYFNQYMVPVNFTCKFKTFKSIVDFKSQIGGLINV